MAPDNTHLAENLKILRECCEREGYRFELIDHFSGYLARVSHGDQAFLAGAGRVSSYPLNSATPSEVARDKGHTYELLKQAGFTIPQTAHVFVSDERRNLRPPGRELPSALQFAADVGFPVFVKPNLGSFARDSGVAYDESELLYRLITIGRRDYSAIVQQFIEATEYRLFVLDGKVMFAYRKSRPVLTGDGQSTINDLVESAALNHQPVERSFLSDRLSREGWSLETIPAAGTRIELSSVANLSAGGVLEDLIKQVPPKVSRWASELAATTMLRVFSVDVLTTSSFHDAAFTTLDVNGSPSLTTVYALGFQEMVLGLWAEILARYFSVVESLER